MDAALKPGTPGATVRRQMMLTFSGYTLLRTSWSLMLAGRRSYRENDLGIKLACETMVEKCPFGNVKAKTVYSENRIKLADNCSLSLAS